jgi:DNA repair protein RecO (recombination protein O)
MTTKRSLSRPSLPPAKRLGAVVLSRLGRGDSDLVVTFITREQGKITALAKNARQSIRRFGGNLLRPGTAAWYYFRQKPRREIAFVERGEINPKAPVLPSEPICLALSAWALELVKTFEVHDNPALASFNLLVNHLGDLAKTDNFHPPALEARRLSLGFTKCYLKLAGFAPILTECSLCAKTESSIWYWDPVIGGIICQDCLTICGRNPSRPPTGLIQALAATSNHKNCPPLDEQQFQAAEFFFQTMATHQSGRLFKSRKVFYELLNKK